MKKDFVNNLRGLNFMLIHPPDEDGNRLMQNLRRIGCNVRAVWPLPNSIPADVNVLILSIEHETKNKVIRAVRGLSKNIPTIIAVVGSESPVTIEVVLECRAVGVIEKPIRSFGLLTSIAVARSQWARTREKEKELVKLEKKLLGLKKIGKAKSILIEMNGITENEAYNRIRKQAMAKRTTMEEIAVAIINANELMGNGAIDRKSPASMV